MGALIELRGVAKRFDNGGVPLEVLAGVDLRIERGEFLAITGPSGSGKTTLLEILGALSRPSSGAQYFDGFSLAELDDDGRADLRANRMGFVFQNFNLIPRRTAVRNVALPLLYAGVARRERERRATSMLERVGLGHRLDHPPARLSGGERQRVGIARALVNEPHVVFADEPTGNLDARTGEDILSLFRALHGEGRTLVIVTHDPKVAAVAERVIRIADGRIVSDVARA